MYNENQKHAFERKLEKDEICSELAKIWEYRKSEPPSPVIEVKEFRYQRTKKQLVCTELIVFVFKIHSVSCGKPRGGKVPA